MKTIQTIDIAIEQLETAIELYQLKGPSFSIITLAGAAEEMLGKLVTEMDKKNHLKEMDEACQTVHLALAGKELPKNFVATRENEVRNFIKHANPVKQPNLDIDLKRECDDMLSRAIVNYQLCQSVYTPKIAHFIAQVFRPMA